MFVARLRELINDPFRFQRFDLAAHLVCRGSPAEIRSFSELRRSNVGEGTVTPPGLRVRSTARPAAFWNVAGLAVFSRIGDLEGG